VDYQLYVPLLDAGKVAKTLPRLTGSANKQKKDSPKHLPKDLSEELGHLFPEKTAHLGRENLIALIDAGKKESKKYDFGTEEPLLVILMFLFGHGCTRDPLFPWISRTLQDKQLADVTARAGQLEKKTLKWLEQVWATPKKGEQ